MRSPTISRELVDAGWDWSRKVPAFLNLRQSALPWLCLVRTYALPAALIVCATVLLRLPFQTHLLAHWDSVQYALGLDHFDVLRDQPQPPGSPYYILLGRALLAFTHDPRQAFLVLALAASAGAALGVYAVTVALFNRRAAWLATAAFITQPIFWGYGSSANAWTMLALFASLVGLSCVLLQRRVHSASLPSALLMALASGFRPDVPVFLGPLWLWSLWRGEPRRGRRWLALAIVVLGSLAWLVPVVLVSGGPALFLRSEQHLWIAQPVSQSLLQQAKFFVTSTAVEWGVVAVTVGPILVLGFALAGRRMVAAARSPEVRRWLPVIAVWVVPSFVFLWLVDTTEDGHDFLLLVGLYPLAAGLVALAVRSRARLLVGTACLVAVQTAVFLFAPPLSGQPLTYTANTALLGLTRPALQQRDAALMAAIQQVQARYAPRDTVIVTSTVETEYRFAMYYLPEFGVLRMPPAPENALVVTGRYWRTDYVPGTSCLVDDSVRHVLWMVDALDAATLAPTQQANLVLRGNAATSGISLYDVQVPPEGTDVRGYHLGGCSAAWWQAPAPSDAR